MITGPIRVQVTELFCQSYCTFNITICLAIIRSLCFGFISSRLRIIPSRILINGLFKMQMAGIIPSSVTNIGDHFSSMDDLPTLQIWLRSQMQVAGDEDSSIGKVMLQNQIIARARCVGHGSHDNTVIRRTYLCAAILAQIHAVMVTMTIQRPRTKRRRESRSGDNVVIIAAVVPPLLYLGVGAADGGQGVFSILPACRIPVFADARHVGRRAKGIPHHFRKGPTGVAWETGVPDDALPVGSKGGLSARK